MNATFEYYLRLTRFRNIDLPLQGLYFVQLRFDCGSGNEYPVQIVPYSASSQMGHVTMHSLFPPQISPEDALQSSGFIIQFSEESVILSDSFRISLKDTMYLTKSADDIPTLCGSVKSFDKTIRLNVDLLFSDAAESGGLDALLKNNITSFPTEYTIVASQSYLIEPPGSGAEFFRIPLGLLRENSAPTETPAGLVGDIYPCAFLEGILCSVMTQMRFPSEPVVSGMSEFVQQMSREVCIHKALLSNPV